MFDGCKGAERNDWNNSSIIFYSLPFFTGKFLQVRCVRLHNNSLDKCLLFFLWCRCHTHSVFKAHTQNYVVLSLTRLLAYTHNATWNAEQRYQMCCEHNEIDKITCPTHAHAQFLFVCLHKSDSAKLMLIPGEKKISFRRFHSFARFSFFFSSFHFVFTFYFYFFLCVLSFRFEIDSIGCLVLRMHYAFIRYL